MTPKLSRLGFPMLDALGAAARAAGHAVTSSPRYRGASDWLMLYGVGAPDNAAARAAHVASGRNVILWDIGYFGRMKSAGYLRVSVNTDHPQAWLDDTADDPSRWAVHGINLREDYRSGGHIVLVGIGRKSHAYLGKRAEGWEQQKLAELQRRFPGCEIIYRPKPRSPALKLACRTEHDVPIERLLRGAALVVCRHSNVAIDAAVAGIPFECEDGAARWLAARQFTRGNRLQFLRRLSWWQWKADEAVSAWSFLMCMIGNRAPVGVAA